MDQACNVDGCRKRAQRSGLCWGHLKRKQRQANLSSPLRERGIAPSKLIERTALAYANAETDEEFRRAQKRLRVYVARMKARELCPQPVSASRNIVHTAAEAGGNGGPEGTT